MLERRDSFRAGAGHAQDTSTEAYARGERERETNREGKRQFRE